MSKITENQPEKIGFWARIGQTFDLIEKSETDYLWDEVARLRHRQSELELELKARTADRSFIAPESTQA